jgi:hypothetical protein
MRENFSFNPINWIKTFFKKIIEWIVKAIVVGIVLMIVVGKSGLMDEKSFHNYMTYLIIGSIVLYSGAFIYFMYLCRDQDPKDYKEIALCSIVGPVVIIVQILLLVFSKFIYDVPEIGPLIYFILWTPLGIGITGGSLFATSSTIAEIKLNV